MYYMYSYIRCNRHGAIMVVITASCATDEAIKGYECHAGECLELCLSNPVLLVKRLLVMLPHCRHKRIHHMKPKRRENGKQKHAGVSSGQLRAFFEISEQMVRDLCVCVMVGMSLEFEEQGV